MKTTATVNIPDPRDPANCRIIGYRVEIEEGDDAHEVINKAFEVLDSPDKDYIEKLEKDLAKAKVRFYTAADALSHTHCYPQPNEGFKVDVAWVKGLYDASGCSLREAKHAHDLCLEKQAEHTKRTRREDKTIDLLETVLEKLNRLGEDVL